MRTLVTGADGFAGRWLTRDLAAAGHEVIASPPHRDLDIADSDAVRAFVETARPDAVAHLAAVSFSAEADHDPATAGRTNVGGTVAVIEAARALARPPVLLIISSAEVYRTPCLQDPPLTELSPIAPRSLYGMLKLAQEAVALAAAERDRLPMAIVRPFSHAGPGQRPISAVASFARRVAAVRRGEAQEIAVGNIDVERDIGDVRDYVTAYRLLLEALAAGRLGSVARVFNLATGTPTSLRWVLDELCRLAGVQPKTRVVPELVRANDPPRVVGDATALRDATGWRPRIRLAQTLADVFADQAEEPLRPPGKA